MYTNLLLNKKVHIIATCFLLFSNATCSLVKILDTNVEFVESEANFTMVGRMIGVSQGMLPKEAPEQAILKYEKKLQSLPEEKLLMRANQGLDGREYVKNTTHYPYCCFAHVNSVFAGDEYGGSGVLVGPYHLLTAAHCVFNLTTGDWAEAIHVYCGLNGDAAPFGQVRGVRAYIPEAYSANRDKNYDIALVILDKPLGMKAGYLGCLFAQDISMFDEKINITGFPGDKGFKTMWSMSHIAKKIEGERIYYDIDTYGGQSGSPIWSQFDLHLEGKQSRRQPLVVGIHTHGEGLEGEGNSGIRLTEIKFRQIMQWIATTKEILIKATQEPFDCENVSALDNLTMGLRCLRGIKVKKDPVQARVRLEKAAAQDEEPEIQAWASLHSSIMYYFGLGVPKNGPIAKDYLEKARTIALERGESLKEILAVAEILKNPHKAHEKPDLEYNRSTLHEAAINGYSILVEVLLYLGLEVDIEAKDGFTALHAACLHEREEIVEILLAHKANPNKLFNNRLSPLWCSTSNRPNSQITRILLEHGALPTLVSAEGKTFLHTVQSKELAEIFISRGVSVHAEDNEGKTPLHCAANKEIVETLIAHGASVKSKDREGNTPLASVCSRWQSEPQIGRALLKAGAQIVARNNLGETILHIAAKNCLEMLKMALEMNPDVLAVDNKGNTALHLACGMHTRSKEDSAEAIKLLLQAGSRLETKNDEGKTPLFEAIYASKIPAIEVLLKAGANCTVKDGNGMDALMTASFIDQVKGTGSTGKPSIVSILITHLHETNPAFLLQYVKTLKAAQKK